MSSAEAILAAVENAIRQHAPLDNITFSGNGEPTIHPQFAHIVAETRRLRDQLVPGAQLAVLSCAATLRSAAVREALACLDQAVVKLDVGDEESLRRLNRPCPGVSFAEILSRMTELRPAVIQSMVVGGPAGNDTPAQRQAWMDAVAQVGPGEVQLYSLGRMPAEQHVEPVARERLEEMAVEIRQKRGVRVLVY